MHPLTPRLHGVNLYLIGMMGVGKSTIGQMLGQQLGYQFFDTDAVIEQVTQQSVRTIFATAGEAAFRQLETQVLAELSSNVRLVIATGGGIVLQRQNWSYLRHGIVIWLDAPIELLYQRLQQDTTRPLLQDPDPQQKLQTLLTQRQALYAQADVHVPIAAEQTPADVVEQVNEAVQAVLRTDRSTD